MKKIISGCVIIYCSTLIFLQLHQNALYRLKDNNITYSIGKYGTLLMETYGFIPFIINVILAILGLILIWIGAFEKDNP